MARAGSARPGPASPARGGAFGACHHTSGCSTAISISGNEVLLPVIRGHTLALAPSIEAAYDFIMQALRAQECWQGSERSCCPKFIHVCWSLRFAPCRLCAARSAFRLNMLHAAPLVPSGWRFFGSSNTSNA